MLRKSRKSTKSKASKSRKRRTSKPKPKPKPKLPQPESAVPVKSVKSELPKASIHQKGRRSKSKFHCCENSQCGRVESVENSFKMCGNCRVRYCSVECSKNDWATHKFRCKK